MKQANSHNDMNEILDQYQKQFIKVKLSGHKPEFKDLIGLIKSDTEGHYLNEFARFVHNGKHTCIATQGDTCKVESNKGSFSYLLFTTHILKTDIYRGTKTLYKR